MEEVQAGITEICKTAVENRGSLTDEEIEKLENYFERLNELTQQELDIQQQKAESIKQIAVDEANTYEGSLEDYQELSQKWIKTAQEQYDAQVQLAEQNEIEQLALLNKSYDDQNKAHDDYYFEQVNRFKNQKEQAVSEAKEQFEAVNAAYKDGYFERAEILQDWLEKITNYLSKNAKKQNIITNSWMSWSKKRLKTFITIKPSGWHIRISTPNRWRRKTKDILLNSQIFVRHTTPGLMRMYKRNSVPGPLMSLR